VAPLQREWEVHAVPLRLVQEYLQELGGHLTSKSHMFHSNI
jgi:hypothetical protein